jgi:large subunit ribosomal protein L25
MPDYIEVDISELQLGKSIKVGALTATEFEILNSDRSPIASVELTRAQRGKQSAGGNEEEATEEEA